MTLEHIPEYSYGLLVRSYSCERPAIQLLARNERFSLKSVLKVISPMMLMESYHRWQPFRDQNLGSILDAVRTALKNQKRSPRTHIAINGYQPIDYEHLSSLTGSEWAAYLNDNVHVFLFEFVDNPQYVEDIEDCRNIIVNRVQLLLLVPGLDGDTIEPSSFHHRCRATSTDMDLIGQLTNYAETCEWALNSLWGIGADEQVVLRNIYGLFRDR